ncbi:alpha/beta fold hydrolase [Actinoplanes sp. NPDC051411]|uniref:alpha/beta fold hydrolase n=1 Tax=Actinoplanes sp. NPDC051411 TaxID=3155522 RepID=UPI003415A929
MPFFGPGLAYREVGEGRPLVLLHGFAGDGSLWPPVPGFRVVLPDFRGHGSSAQPLDKDFYPPDVLADDGLALIEHLGLDDYDLGGYSLGARIVVRMLVRGARPRRAVVGGQGLREVQGIGGGAGAAFRKRVAEPNALVHVLDSLVATPVEALPGITTPTLVVIGRDDERAASGRQLADALPHGTYAEIPGNHGTAAAGPDLIAAMLTWLS